MILKAGTYRFNDVLERANIPSNTLYKGFSTTVDGEGVNLGIMYCDNYTAGNTVQNGLFFGGIMYDIFPPLNPFIYGDADISGTVYDGWQEGLTVESASEYYGNITADTEVDDTFGEWYIANTNYNEVNAKPLAEITYNGETFSLDAGDKATIPCKEFKMRTDVVVKVNKVEGGSSSGEAIGAITALAVEVDSIENPTEKSATIAKYNNNFYILTEV